MINQFASIKTYASALRRRKRTLAVAAVVGLALGAAYVVVEPAPLTSTTLVLLPTPALADSSNSDVNTQSRIATSASLLEQAGQTVDPILPVRRVEKMVDVTAPTNQLLEIEATSTDGAEAQALSQAVADGYVNYVRDTAREVTTTALKDLTNRRDDLDGQLKQVRKEMAATTARLKALDPVSPEADEEAQLLAGLTTEEANLIVQLDRVKDKIAEGTPAGTSASGTLVVQPATAAIGQPTWLRLLIWAPIAALVCLFAAVALVLAGARRDPRIRLRDDIADAVGSPVLAGIRSQPQRSVAGWSTLLEAYQATPVESWAMRQVLRGLVPADRRSSSRSTGRVDHPQTLTVVSLAGDGQGLALGPQLAAFAASLGIITRLVPTVGHVRAPNLWAACAVDRDGAARPGLFVGAMPSTDKVDLTIYLVVVERMHPYLGDTPATEATLLVVGAATATDQELARVAVAVDDTGRRIDGIVVADPDQDDRTSGRHTMDERSRQLVLPTRLTGITAADQPASDSSRGRP